MGEAADVVVDVVEAEAEAEAEADVEAAPSEAPHSSAQSWRSSFISEDCRVLKARRCGKPVEATNWREKFLLSDSHQVILSCGQEAIFMSLGSMTWTPKKLIPMIT